MASFTPYTYFQCPCTDTSPPSLNLDSTLPAETEEISDSDDRTFDPRAPRSNYTLYPLEHLLYCEDCHQIRCPRCVLDEIVTWYCPNCLFEVPSSTVKGEGNRSVFYPFSSSELRTLKCMLTSRTDVREAAFNARYALLPSQSAAPKPRPRDWAPI